MEFILYYKGRLEANGDRKEKHQIRRTLHQQLKEYFRFRYGEKELKNAEFEARQEADASRFHFVPIIEEECVAEIQITMLRPEAPGKIITKGGDIDNRLKTLFDALKVPSEPNSLPQGIIPDQDEKPFFCLLADDKLITSIAVTTFQLHDPTVQPPDVILLIQVKTKESKPFMVMTS